VGDAEEFVALRPVASGKNRAASVAGLNRVRVATNREQTMPVHAVRDTPFLYHFSTQLSTQTTARIYPDIHTYSKCVENKSSHTWD
jgi:hypothetical protein